VPAARVPHSSIRGAEAADVNAEGRVCVQIGVLGHPGDPFTGGPLTGVSLIVNWLDSWGIPRRWPAGRPTDHYDGGPPADVSGPDASRAQWALGGHFGASQVPGCASHGPGGIDTDLLTGTHIRHVHQRESRHPLSSAALAIPALEPRGRGAGDPQFPRESFRDYYKRGPAFFCLTILAGRSPPRFRAWRYQSRIWRACRYDMICRCRGRWRSSR
jgi:hypothetical protein